MAVLDTFCLDRLSAEAEVSRKEVALVLEGIRDLLSLNLREESKVQLRILESRWTTRLNKSTDAVRGIAEAKGKIDILKADGHPVDPGVIVDKEVIEDIDANLDTQQAARRRFTPRPITTTGTITFSEQVPADF